MKFENIKEGDTVYSHRGVRYGFNSNRYFYVPVKVIKTTKTQFTCENNKRYQKDSGREIGGGYSDRVSIGSKEVFDQRHEMKNFIFRVKKINTATDLIYNLDKIRNRVNPKIDMAIIEDFIISAQKLLLTLKE